jgi:hypothetical protein
MKKASVIPARRIYVLRVSIRDSRPPIWRKLSVPGNFTLEDLHVVLQIAFGWDEEHMHSFTINSREYGMAQALEMMTVFDDAELIDEATVRLDDLLTEKQKFTYLYEFGDSWLHRISVSKVIPLEEGMEDSPAPRCLGGKLAAPPEDCGGIWGYEELLAILKDPDHERHGETYEWLGDWDTEAFDPEEINASLARVFGKKPAAPKKTSRGSRTSSE